MSLFLCNTLYSIIFLYKIHPAPITSKCRVSATKLFNITIYYSFCYKAMYFRYIDNLKDGEDSFAHALMEKNKTSSSSREPFSQMVEWKNVFGLLIIEFVLKWSLFQIPKIISNSPPLAALLELDDLCRGQKGIQDSLQSDKFFPFHQYRHKVRINYDGEEYSKHNAFCVYFLIFFKNY